MTQVNPPPILRIPEEFLENPAARRFFEQQRQIMFQLWKRTGGATDLIDDALLESDLGVTVQAFSTALEGTELSFTNAVNDAINANSAKPAGIPLEVQEGASQITTDTKTINFTGAGVSTVATAADEIDVNISGIPGTASIDDLVDVDTATNPPEIGDDLLWDGTNWVTNMTQLIKEVDFDGDFIYIGEAQTGTLLSDSTWRISRTEFIGDDSKKRYANGTVGFTNEWNNHLTYPYT
jgi:hypothetical protein